MGTFDAPTRDVLVTPGVALATLATGGPLLGAAITAPRGGAAFRRRTAALAATWTAGGAATGQFQPRLWQVRDKAELTDRVLRPAAKAAAAIGVFAAGAVVVSKVPFLRREIETVMAHATQGSFAQAAALALVTGATEEIFFRGTVHDLADTFGLRPVRTSTAVYTAITTATGNPLLVFAAGALGLLAGHERERTDSLVAPTVVHLGWSLGMLTVLPRVTRRQRRQESGTDAAEA